MKKGTLRAQYGLLTPTERVSLFLAACVRGDLDEATVLQRTCPHGQVRDVVARIEAFVVPTQRFALPWAEAIRFVAWSEVLGRWGARHCWRAWRRFADSTGVNPRGVLAVFAPWILADLDGLAPHIEDLDNEEDEDLTAAPQDHEEAVGRLASLFQMDYRNAVAAISNSRTPFLPDYTCPSWMR